jgi:hypothetical protein
MQAMGTRASLGQVRSLLPSWTGHLRAGQERQIAAGPTWQERLKVRHVIASTAHQGPLVFVRGRDTEWERNSDRVQSQGRNELEWL